MLSLKKPSKKSGKGIREVFEIFRAGDIFTKLSFFIFGLSNIVRGQVVKGFMFLLLEVTYIYYIIISGVSSLAGMKTLGTKKQGMVLNEESGIFEITNGDNSMLMLLFGVVFILVSIIFVGIWISSIKSGENARKLKSNGKKVPGMIEDIKSLFDSNIHRLFLGVPIVGIVTFTVLPLIFMILMAFTNYDQGHQPPGNLFTWVGLKNFSTLFASAGILSKTFWPVFSWTLIWGFASTFSCYFGGILLACLINSKGIKGKKVWRTIFIMTMAIPSFITLLIVRTMLGGNGIVNVLLLNLGFTETVLPFLTSGIWAKWTCIIVNLWIGIPVTMLMTTGILMNIPEELYESAKIDGASSIIIFVKITMPYMLFITTPYLIANFISNLNNFGAIYFLTAGEPLSLEFYKGAGKTDLLVTWLYKLTRDSKDYNYAATIGIVIFVICAVSSLIVYSRSKAFKEEEGFQ